MSPRAPTAPSMTPTVASEPPNRRTHARALLVASTISEYSSTCSVPRQSCHTLLRSPAHRPSGASHATTLSPDRRVEKRCTPRSRKFAASRTKRSPSDLRLGLIRTKRPDRMGDMISTRSMSTVIVRILAKGTTGNRKFDMHKEKTPKRRKAAPMPVTHLRKFTTSI